METAIINTRFELCYYLFNQYWLIKIYDFSSNYNYVTLCIYIYDFKSEEIRLRFMGGGEIKSKDCHT